jgi:hypothetical protein
MPLIIPANTLASGGFAVDNSLRFNDGSSDNLNRTPGSASNRKTWTFSAWIKRSTISTAQRIFSQGDHTSGDPMTFLAFKSDDTLQFNRYVSGATELVTNRKFRDVSAWYHIVFRCDTTNGTAGDRFRLYINGVEETSFATDNNPSLNADTEVNNTQKLELGSVGATTQNFDGYMAEVVLIDGTALDPTSFGEFDEDSGIWKPISVSGLTFGTNGFYLDFENSGSLGADVSGNGNNFTVNNLTAIDQTTDTCINNYATLNPLDNYYASSTFSEGNCKIVTSSGNMSYNTGTIAVSQGKWYVEAKVVDNADSNYHHFGIAETPSTSTSNWLGVSATHYGLTGFDGKIWRNNSGTAYGVSSTTGDIVGMYLDLDNNKLYFAKNGTIMNSGTGYSIVGASLTTNGYYLISYGDWENLSSATWEVNFGNPTYSISSGNTDSNGYGNFEYSPNDGGSASFDSTAKDFYALNTKNLAEFG